MPTQYFFVGYHLVQKYIKVLYRKEAVELRRRKEGETPFQVEVRPTINSVCQMKAYYKLVLRSQSDLSLYIVC